jgi:hypothetical protein
LAGVPKQRGASFHAYRRAWATARKHLLVTDVAAAWGWKSTARIQRCYQRPDEENMLAVVLVAPSCGRRRRESRAFLYRFLHTPQFGEVPNGSKVQNPNTVWAVAQLGCFASVFTAAPGSPKSRNDQRIATNGARPGFGSRTASASKVAQFLAPMALAQRLGASPRNDGGLLTRMPKNVR